MLKVISWTPWESAFFLGGCLLAVINLVVISYVLLEVT